jgi:hypothetical protein
MVLWSSSNDLDCCFMLYFNAFCTYGQQLTGIDVRVTRRQEDSEQTVKLQSLELVSPLVHQTIPQSACSKGYPIVQQEVTLIWAHTFKRRCRYPSIV